MDLVKGTCRVSDGRHVTSTHRNIGGVTGLAVVSRMSKVAGVRARAVVRIRVASRESY